MPKITDPALLAQLNGKGSTVSRTKVTDPAVLAQLNGIAAPASSTAAANAALRESLPMPDAPNPQAVAAAKAPNLHFGMSSSDTLNPIPALDAFGSQALSSIPVAGPYLRRAAGGGNNADAANIAANPEAAAAGRFAGVATPYAVAAELPVINQVMGFAGPMVQKAIMTGISQYALNTGDNLAHGQTLAEANKNAILPSALAVPLSLLGPSGKATGAHADAVAGLRAEGIPLTAGQQKGSNALMQAESQMGGIAAQNFRDKQLSGLTQTALKYAGVDAKAATPAVMDKAYVDIGNKLGTLASMSKVRVDTKLMNGLVDPASTYYSATGEAPPIFKTIADQVRNASSANGGVLPGSAYQAVSTKISDAMKANPRISGPLHDMQDALNDAVERGTSGKTLEAWQKTRQQYANLMRVTDAVNVAGGTAKAGLITPEALDTAVRNSMSKRQYARGYGDLNQLSRDAVIAMPRLPNSGTAARAAPYVIASGVGGALSSQSPTHAIAGALGTLVAPRIAGAAMLSGPGRALLAGGSTVPGVVARSILPQLLPKLAPPIGSGLPYASGVMG